MSSSDDSFREIMDMGDFSSTSAQTDVSFISSTNHYLRLYFACKTSHVAMSLVSETSAKTDVGFIFRLNHYRMLYYGSFWMQFYQSAILLWVMTHCSQFLDDTYLTCEGWHMSHRLLVMSHCHQRLYCEAWHMSQLWTMCHHPHIVSDESSPYCEGGTHNYAMKNNGQ